MRHNILKHVAVCLSLFLFLSASASTQGIQIYVAGPVGGSLDNVARKLANKLSTHTTVLVSNAPTNNLTEAIEGLAKNSDWNLLIAEVSMSIATEAQMNRLKALNQLSKVAYLYERSIEPNTPANSANIPIRVVAGIYAHPRALSMWSDRVQQGVKALGAEGFDYTFGGRNVVAFNQTANALTVANMQLSQTQPAASNTPAPIAQQPAGAAQPSNNAPTSVTSAQAGVRTGTGKWPAGVEPGNLYIVRYSLHTGVGYYEELMLISARSRAEAEQQYERAYTVYRDERLKPFYDQGGTAGRANLAFHAPSYKMDYQVTQECLGANWGAVVSVSESRSLNGTGAACGARTPAEAITAAFEVCSRKGYNCNREGTRNATPIITIAHSGARPWVEPINKPRVGSSWPPATFQFTALSATTYQMHASTIDYVQGPNEAIASFGKACGKKSWPRDIYSCWITSRNLSCINNSPINPQDKMPMQQTCIDVKLTKDGYLP